MFVCAAPRCRGIRQVSRHSGVRMPTIRLSVDDAYIQTIRDGLKKITDTESKIDLAEIAREALGLYGWAIGQMAKDNAVCSADRNGMLVVQADLPSTSVNPDYRMGDGDALASA